MLSAAQISAAIRAKKKQMMDSDPEIVDTSPTPDMNAQDVYDMNQKARIESTLMVPKKVSSDESMADMTDEENLDLAPTKRMVRLKAYLDSLDS